MNYACERFVAASPSKCSKIIIKYFCFKVSKPCVWKNCVAVAVYCWRYTKSRMIYDTEKRCGEKAAFFQLKKRSRSVCRLLLNDYYICVFISQPRLRGWALFGALPLRASAPCHRWPLRFSLWRCPLPPLRAQGRYFRQTQRSPLQAWLHHP